LEVRKVGDEGVGENKLLTHEGGIIRKRGGAKCSKYLVKISPKQREKGIGGRHSIGRDGSKQQGETSRNKGALSATCRW